MADAQFKAAAARLRATLASKYTPTEATVTAGAVGGSKVYIGGQLYEGTVDGVQAVKNTGRLAAAQYAPATGGSATVRSVSAVDEGGLAYLPLNGSAAMTGDLDMGSNDLTNVSLVDGRDVSADGATLDALQAAPVLTVGTHATLTNERALTFSDAFGVTDGGAGSTYTVALTTPGTLSASSANAAAGAHTHAITASSNPGVNASLLKSAADGSLTLTTLTATTKVATPTLENASGSLLLDPSMRVVTVDGSLVARYSASATVGAVVQNVQDIDAAYVRAVFGYNTFWDETNNWWNLGTVGANDAATFLVRNGSSAIDVIFHPSSGNVTRTMDHATFTGGTKFTLTSAGKLGVLNNGPTYQVDVTGDIRATQTVYAEAKVQTPLITTASNMDLVIDPAGAVKFPNAQTVRTSTFDSGVPLIQGWQFNEVSAGSSYSVLSIGKLRANELLVDIFVANETRVDRGDQLWTKSYGILYSDFTTPSAIGGTATLTVEDSPAITGAIFTNNDWVLLRKLDITTGVALFQVWGQVATYVNNANGSQSWNFTLRSGPTSKLIPRGSLAIDFGATGQAFMHLSVIDPAGAPYLKLRKWAGSDPYTAANYTTYVQMGHLGSVGNSYYTPAGYGLYLRATAGADRFLVADDNGLQLRGASLALYNGANQTVNLSYTGQDVWIGTANTDKRLIWDGNLLTVKGTILVTGGDAAKVDFSNLTATLDNLGDGSTFKRTNANEKSGAARAYSALNSSNVLVTSVVPATAIGTPGVAGLYLGSDYMGYHTGNGAASGWKTYLDNAGNFRFLGNATNNYIQWVAASNKLQGVGGGTEQWYADATDGKIKAGGGSVELSALGIDLQQDGYLVVDRSRALAWWPTISNKTGTPSQEIIGYYDANSRSVLSLTATNATFGSRILLTAGDIAVTGTMSISGALSAVGGIAATGTVTATTGMSVGGTAVSLVGHMHSYLPLSGGILTGAVTTQMLQPAATNTHNLGTSGAYYNNAYINNLYTNVIVGTPSYAHSHAASDITSGVLDFARIPTTWTGALTLDVDAAGAYNYVRFKTDATNSKVWDLIAYAWDHATTAVRNDLALTYTVGSTATTLFLADGATGVLDFTQTPTVAGTAVSLATHNHDSSYVAQGTYTTHLSSDAHPLYLLATGARAGATSQAQAFTNGVVTPLLTTASGNLNITPAGGTTAFTGSLSLTSSTGAGFTMTNTATTQYSSAALVLRNSEVADTQTNWYFFAEKSAAGAATGVSTFQIRKRNASGTEAVTPFVINGNNDVVLNGGYSNGTQTYGNVGIKKVPTSGVALDVNGNIAAAGVVFLANGDVTAPGLATTGDTNTGVYFPSADNVAITTGGVQRLLLDNAGTLTLNSRASVVVGANTLELNPLPDATGTSEVRLFRLTNTSGSKGLRILQGDNTTTTVHYLGVNGTTIFNAALADLDFNVRGDNDTNLLYVDAGTDRIGVGVSTPQAKLHVYSTADESLRLESSIATGSPYLSFMQAGIRRGFIQQHDSSDTLTLASEYGNVNIKAAATAGTDSDTTYLVVKAGGYVGVNTADPQYTLDVTGDIFVSSGMLSNAWAITSDGAATFTNSIYAPALYANGTDLVMGSVSGNTIVNAAGNVDLRINNVSQWLINTTRLLPRSTGTLDIGDYYRRVRTLHASELYVETLVAQGVLATIGGRIVVAPTTRLIADVTLAATTIDVAHNNLVNGAYIYLNAAPNSFAQLEAMQVTSAATTIGGGYRYTVTRNLDGSGANAWNVGDAVVSLGSAVGQGYIDLSSTSTIHNHYGPAQTMYVRTSTATWNGVKPVTTTGNLRSFVDYSADEFGFATGNDLTLTPATGFRGVTVDRTNGVRLFNTDIRLYSGATLQASFDYADGLNMLADSSASARRQQINWWSNMADRSGIPLTELYTYVNAGTGPTLTMKTRAAPGTNGVLMELIAIGNSAVAGSIYISEDSSAVKKVVLDSNNVHLRYNSTDRLWVGNGGVGVNQATASYALDVNGSCHATSFPTSSDARLKTVLGPVTQVLDRLGNINAYRFQWAPHYHGYDQYLDKQGRPTPQIGFLAQEVEAQFPELVSHWQHTGRNGEVLEDALAVDYSRMVPLLLMAIRELRAEVDSLCKGR